MSAGHCQVCGRPLPPRGGPGRGSVYCSPACRQKAYRQRPDAVGVPEPRADLSRRLASLEPHPPTPFHDEVSEVAAGSTGAFVNVTAGMFPS